MMQIPRRNSVGQSQKITFEAPSSVSVTTKELKLAATADSGMKVRFYVREGPAEMDDDTLKLTAIPPRTRFPVAVTVVAWQFGRANGPQIQSAEPVVRQILVEK
jgi:hypothetical protein